MYVRPTSMTPHAVFYDLINQLTSGRETSLGHQIREKNTREKSSWESKIKPGAVVCRAKPLINKRFFPRRGTVGLSPAILHFINNCYHEARQTRTKDGYQASLYNKRQTPILCHGLPPKPPDEPQHIWYLRRASEEHSVMRVFIFQKYHR